MLRRNIFDAAFDHQTRHDGNMLWLISLENLLHSRERAGAEVESVAPVVQLVAFGVGLTTCGWELDTGVGNFARGVGGEIDIARLQSIGHDFVAELAREGEVSGARGGHEYC